MTGEQLELSERREDAWHDGAEELLSTLAVHGGWVTRAALRYIGWTDRAIRQARQHSHGRIIAGQRGFKASRLATREELCEAANQLASQAKVMGQEAAEVWAFVHRGEG